MAPWLLRLGQLRRALLVGAAVLLLVTIALPIWEITLDAPQYPPPEGPLEVELYTYPRLGGDYEEVDRLNAYVGFHYPDPVWVEPDFPVHEHSIETPEWVVAPVVFIILALLCVFVAVAPDPQKLRKGLWSLLIGTLVIFLGALAAVQYRLYQAGHNLSPDAPMDLEGFTPPVVGSYEVANISGFAWVGPGGYATVLAVVLMVLAVMLRHRDTTFADLWRRWMRRGAGDESDDESPRGDDDGAHSDGEDTSEGNDENDSETDGEAGSEDSDEDDSDSGDRSSESMQLYGVFLLAVIAAVAGAPLFAPPSPKHTTTTHFTDPGETEEFAEVTGPPQATIGDRNFSNAQEAVEAAQPGQTVVLRGRFDERVVIDTADVTLRADKGGAVLDGLGRGRVLTVAAEGVTVEGVWIRNSGSNLAEEDSGVFVAEGAHGTRLRHLRLTEVAFGVWIDGASNVAIAHCSIQGRDDVFPRVERGNGIQLWQADDAVIEHNRISEVRDGIYFSWSEGVVASHNQLFHNRYGVHYMYSNDNRLESNIAIDNDVGYALMISRRLQVTDNVARRNRGASSHGILIKDVDDSVLRGNQLIGNGNGFYVYNAQDNVLEQNLVGGNDVGLVYTAGSDGNRLADNNFVDNDQDVLTTGRDLQRWNHNYWSRARTIDLSGDGVSEIRHRPAGAVEALVERRPTAGVFVHSPAFDVVRLAEDSFPVIEAPGVIDEGPRVTPQPYDEDRHEAGR